MEAVAVVYLPVYDTKTVAVPAAPPALLAELDCPGLVGLHALVAGPSRLLNLLVLMLALVID